MTSFDTKAYWEKRLAETWDLGGVGLAAWGVHYNKWLYRVRSRVFRRAVAGLKLDFANLRVLDIGSGTGFYIDQWRRLGVRNITGIDISETAVSKLRGRFPDHDFHELSIGDEVGSLKAGSFDAISCMDVLFHIVDDEKYGRAFRNIQSLLAPNGVFAFSEGFTAETVRSGEHVVHRRATAIRDHLSAAGLEIFRRRPMFVLMTEPIASKSRLLRKFSRGLRHLLIKHPRTGRVVGPALYPAEILLTSMMRNGPSLTLALCRTIQS